MKSKDRKTIRTRETEGKAFPKLSSDMTEKLESKNRRLMAERRSLKAMTEKLESKYRRLMAEILRSLKDKEEELESKYRRLMAERRSLNDKMSKLFRSLAERNAKEREKCEPEYQRSVCSQCSSFLGGSVQSQTGSCICLVLTKGGSDGQDELRWKNPQVKSPDVVTSESGTNTDSYEEDAEADRVRDGFNRGMSYLHFNHALSVACMARYSTLYQKSTHINIYTGFGRSLFHKRERRSELSGFSGYRSDYGKEKKTQTNGVGDKTYGNVMKRPWDWEREKGEAQNERKNTSLYSKRDSDSYSNPERLLYWVGNEQSETEIRELEQLLMCKVCLDKDSCIVFFPCRHMATCESCESFLQRCPVCRSQINEAVRINEN